VPHAAPLRMQLRCLLGASNLLVVLAGGASVLSAFLSAPALAQAGRAAGSPSIRSLVLLPAPDPGVAAQPGIDLSHLSVPDPDGLRRRLGPLLNQAVNPDTLKQVKDAVLEHYKDAGRPFLDVGFPPQDVTDGKLAVVVTEFRVGSVAASGNNWFSDRLILGKAGLRPGDLIDKPLLEGRIGRFNENQFIKVTPEFQPGKVPGTTDVTLQAEDRFPVDFSVGYSNTGNPTTGWDRWTLGATWGDALRQGQTLSYQLSTSSSFWKGLEKDMLRSKEPTFIGHTISWSAPLPWGDTLQLSGGYQRQVPDLGASLGSLGITDTLGAQYQVKLGETRQIAFGLDYKRSNNQLAFGGTTVQSGYTEVIEASLRFNGSFTTSFGQTMLENVLYLSPGGLTAANRNGAFMPAADGSHSGTVGAYARYAYDKLTVTEIIPLPFDTGLVLRFTGQESTATLNGSEQLSVAGADAVRGYQEFGLSGSRGILFTAELRGPAWKLGLPNDNLQPHIFFDHGDAWNPTASQSAPAYVHSASAGFGGQYTIDRYFSLTMNQGWQLIRTDRQAANGAFLHIGATATW